MGISNSKKTNHVQPKNESQFQFQVEPPKNVQPEVSSEAKIEWMRVMEDGKVNVSVICGKCKRRNNHQLHNGCVSKNSMFLQIDFDKLGNRCCPSRACDEYTLYE
jgi:hypothetical protein